MAAILDLKGALRICDEHHPRLKELAMVPLGLKGQGLQSGLLPNPSLVLRTEQVPLGGSPNRFIQPIVGISQDIPISGRLGRGEALAKAQMQQAERALEVERKALHRRVRGRFATALYVDKVAQYRRHAAKLAKQLVDLSRARVQAGDLAPAELAAAELEQLQIGLELAKTESTRKRSLHDLAAAIGLPRLSIRGLKGSLERGLKLADAKRLVEGLDASAEMALARAEEESHKRQIELLESERVPDISVDLFYRRLEDDNVDSVDLGVSIPLAIFNRRQGDIMSAKAGLRESEMRTRRLRAELEARIFKANLLLKGALQRSQVLKQRMLPRAKQILASTMTLYQAGEVNPSVMLLQQRQTLSLKLSYLDSLREIMLAWVELSSLAPKS